ncbi:hypothetical protein V1511DRAFT_486049 [Dipodascopsis uninucleata]
MDPWGSTNDAGSSLPAATASPWALDDVIPDWSSQDGGIMNAGSLPDISQETRDLEARVLPGNVLNEVKRTDADSHDIEEDEDPWSSVVSPSPEKQHERLGSQMDGERVSDRTINLDSKKNLEDIVRDVNPESLGDDDHEISANATYSEEPSTYSEALESLNDAYGSEKAGSSFISAQDELKGSNDIPPSFDDGGPSSPFMANNQKNDIDRDSTSISGSDNLDYQVQGRDLDYGFGDNTQEGFYQNKAAGFTPEPELAFDIGEDAFSNPFAPPSKSPEDNLQSLLDKLFHGTDTIEIDNLVSQSEFFADSLRAPPELLSFGQSKKYSVLLARPSRQFVISTRLDALSSSSNVSTDASTKEDGIVLNWNQSIIHNRARKVVDNWRSQLRNINNIFDWNFLDDMGNTKKEQPKVALQGNKRGSFVWQGDATAMNAWKDIMNKSSPVSVGNAVSPTLQPTLQNNEHNPTVLIPQKLTTTNSSNGAGTTMTGASSSVSRSVSSTSLSSGKSTPSLPSLQSVLQPTPSNSNAVSVVDDDNDWGDLMSSDVSVSRSLNAPNPSKVSDDLPASKLSSALNHPDHHHYKHHRSKESSLYIPPPKPSSPESIFYTGSSSSSSSLDTKSIHVGGVSFHTRSRSGSATLSPTAPSMADAKMRDDLVVRRIIDSIPDVSHLTE